MQAPSPRHTAVCGGTGRSKERARLPGGVVVRAVERVPPQAGAQGSRVSLWPLRLSRSAPGLSAQVSARGEMTSSTSMLSPPPPPLGSHLFYPSPTNRGTQDGCGRLGLGKEEGSRPGQARGCGCPSGRFPPCRRWGGGLGSACGAVSGMRGRVTCVPAFPGPCRVCWNGA